MSDMRLIEKWLPIAALGEESVRERRSLQALPPTYYLHVWWARRPLVASRAAILASLLPQDADQQRFMRTLGIHGDPVAAKQRIEIADRKGERLGGDAYGYTRAFSWTPDEEDIAWLKESGIGSNITAIDPTAGGGSVPFESIRLGLSTLANDLNPVASLVQSATLDFPARFGMELVDELRKYGKKFADEVRSRLAWAYPEEPDPNCKADGYLWARTIRCPYCDGLVPLSPNWKLAPDGTGIRLRPKLASGPGDVTRVCDFEVVSSAKEHSPGTISDGDATCPFHDCGRIIDGDDVKSLTHNSSRVSETG